MQSLLSIHRDADLSKTYMKSKYSRQLAFTLIELIMVVVIIGVLAAVAGPRFYSADTFDTRFEYETLKAQMRYAQSYSVASGCYTAFDFSSSLGTIQRDADCDKSNGYCFNVSVVDPDTRLDYEVVTGSTTVPTSIRIIFSPRGEAFLSNSTATCINDTNLVQTPGTSTTLAVSAYSITTEFSTGYIR